MRAQVLEFAKGFGIDDMRTTDHISNTRKVIAIAELARDEGKLDEFRAAGMDAYWRHGKDLEDDAVLREIAVGVGLDADAAIAATRDPKYLGRIDERRREANAIGVTGIPTFVIGDQGVVGCQPYEVLEAFVQDAGAKPVRSG
jgi:predicted DsbA family dithiol-disulfide isomerase